MKNVDLDKIRREKSIKELLEFSIINIDKPSGPTSFQTDEKIKRWLDLRKTSHFGTLDPKVTGVLPIALNRACKLSDYFMHKDKTYVGVMHLHEKITKERLEKEMKKFIGKIMQTPPKKSRVKRQEREREVKKFKIIEIKEQDVLFLAEVQAGTYIRKLCLHPNTEVITDVGLAKIKEFYPKPFKIYSSNKGKIETKEPSKIQKIVSPKKLVKLKTSSGICIIATPDHEILVSKKEGYKMEEFSKLKIGDYLVKVLDFPIIDKNYLIPDLLDEDYLIGQSEIKEKCKKAMIKKFGSIRSMNRELKLDRKVFLSKSKNSISIKHLKLSGIYDEVKDRLIKFKTSKGKIIEIDKLTSDHFYLLGLIASDGNNTREKKTRRFTRLKFHNKNEALINKFITIYKRLFPTIKISKIKVRSNLFQLDSSNSLFASVAAKLGVSSPDKNSDVLPILYCEKELIKSFLRGYFDGDGGCYIKKKRNSSTTYSNIRFFTSNKINAKRIHQMLLKLKIGNRILRKNNYMYVIEINSIYSKKKFIEEIGANHPKKRKILKKINRIKCNNLIWDECYIGFHHKELVRKNKAKLYKMGGNLNRILSSDIPLARGFYRKSSKITNLPKKDNFIIERIDKIELINSLEESVFDMTIPKTHNFLVETGFVSSNCSDLGENIGGAHMTELRRTQAGIFSEEDGNFVDLYNVKEAVEEYKKGDESKLREILIPGEIISKILPVIQANKKSVPALLTGKPIFKGDLKKEDIPEKFAVFSENKFIEVAKKVDEPGILARPEFVMQPIN